LQNLTGIGFKDEEMVEKLKALTEEERAFVDKIFSDEELNETTEKMRDMLRGILSSKMMHEDEDMHEDEEDSDEDKKKKEEEDDKDEYKTLVTRLAKDLNWFSLRPFSSRWATRSMSRIRR
jgi:hypothetical protein